MFIYKEKIKEEDCVNRQFSNKKKNIFPGTNVIKKRSSRLKVESQCTFCVGKKIR